MITLTEQQRMTADKAKAILTTKRVAILAVEVRCGKNFISMSICKELGFKQVLFLTKKKALIGVNSDYDKFGKPFPLFIATNFEQAKNINPIQADDFDVVIVDESHSLGAFPKPSQRTKLIKEIIKGKPVILMSGTLTPETMSQIYHQLWVSEYGPFTAFKNFYQWARQYVIVGKKFVNGFQLNDYSKSKDDLINTAIEPYIIKLSQQDAGFTSFVEEQVIKVPIDSRMYKLMEVLKKDKVYKMKSGHTIVADTPVKLQSLFHQISSGTVKVDETTRITLDESKAYYIKTAFAGQKIAIFYKFIAEGELLRKVFPNHTDNPEEFNNSSDKDFICQMVSGREGVNLSTCDALVAYNIDFSATTYWQMRARMQTKERTKASKMFWIFSEHGLEHEVYKAVSKKKNFTLQYFKRAYQLK